MENTREIGTQVHLKKDADTSKWLPESQSSGPKNYFGEAHLAQFGDSPTC
jgi:hypothetical protein